MAVVALASGMALSGCLQEPEPDYTVPRDASADAARPVVDARDAGLDAASARPSR